MNPRLFSTATRSVIAAVAVATTFSVAHAADWSDWQAMPDHFAGKVAFRLQATGKKGGFRYQLQNGYDQKVTVKFSITGRDASGGAQKDEQTIDLEPGDQTLKGNEQTVDYVSLSGAGLVSIQFSKTPPTPTLGGYYAPSIQIPAYEKAIKTMEKQVEEADKDQKEATADYAATRVAGNSATGQVRRTNSDGENVTTGSSIGELQTAQLALRKADERAIDAHKRLDSLKLELTEAQAADAQAKAAGEKAFQTAQAASKNAPLAASSGTVSMTAANAVIATPGPPTAPTVTVGPLPASAKIATLTGDQMKLLYKSAGDAAKAKDWPTVEKTLRTLLDGSGDTIKPEDRADLNYRLGTAFDNDNKNADAEAAYREAIHLGMNDDSLFNELATVQYSLNEFPEAEKSERSAIEKRNDNASYFFNLGLICMAEKKYKDAETGFRSALHLDPNNEQIKAHIKTAQDAEKGG